MLLTDWNTEEALEVRYEEGVEKGVAIGEARGVAIGEARNEAKNQAKLESLFSLLESGVPLAEAKRKFGIECPNPDTTD